MPDTTLPHSLLNLLMTCPTWFLLTMVEMTFFKGQASEHL